MQIIICIIIKEGIITGMKSTRQRLIEYLETSNVATSLELSHALQVTASDIRHHLKFLQEDGLVEVAGERKPRGRGRPAQLYGLSQGSLDDNLSLLVDLLFDEIIAESPDSLEAALKRIALGLKGEAKPYGNLAQRLYMTVSRLNRLNYQSRWEAHSNAPQVILGRCPYAKVIAAHPELCQLDTILLNDLLKKPVSQIAKLAKDDRGASYCLFLVEIE